MTKAIKIKNEKCDICQNDFAEKDRKEENYVLTGTTFNCKENSQIENHFIHKSCQEIQKERENNPYLFAKVERLEREIMEIKNGNRK